MQKKMCDNPDCPRKNPQAIVNFSRIRKEDERRRNICRRCARDRQKKWYKENKDYYRPVLRTDESRFTRAKWVAKSRNLSWELSIEQWKNLIKDKQCFYCGGQLPETGIGLDRKNNNIGYTFDNCIACCASCNRFKGRDLNFEEMIEVAKLLKQMRSKI